MAEGFVNEKSMMAVLSDEFPGGIDGLIIGISAADNIRPDSGERGVCVCVCVCVVSVCVWRIL